MDEGTPIQVLDFLDDNITSIEQLEVLLLLRKTASRAWTAEEVSRELGSSVMSMRARLADLDARSLVRATEDDGKLVYRYAPANDAVDALVSGLAKAYKERRLTIIDRIYGKPDNGLRSFSDAFLLKKK